MHTPHSFNAALAALLGVYAASSTANESSPTASPAIKPEIAFTLQAQYIDKDAGERHISGFLPVGHAHGCEPEKLCLDHSELGLAVNLSPTVRASTSLVYVDKDIEVEELWLQKVGLGQGFSLKGGRFLSGIGYSNDRHPHEWDFIDASLATQVLSGAHLIHDGLQVKWLAPTDTFVELGGEVAAKSDNSPKAWALFAHTGGDIGVSQSWRAGLSYLSAKPRDREGHMDDNTEVEAETLFSGKARTWVADVVWKWAPDGNPKARNLKLQAEYFRRTEDGTLTCEDNSADGGACADNVGDLRTEQSGWYAQAVYQFMPQWRVGARYDRLDSGTLDFDDTVLPIELEGYRPTRWSLMLDYSPSEMSRLRLQFNRDKSMHGSPDNQVSLQYVHSFGAHGAHKF